MEPNYIYFIGGGKGGVGKSITTCGLIDYFIKLNKKIHVVDTDTSNPDVYKIYSDSVECSHINLDNAEGWIDFINLCADKSEHIVIVNTAARNSEGLKKFASLLTGSLEKLNRKLVTFWVINRQRDSIELLKSYRTLVPSTIIHVLMNGHFGDENKFVLYKDSNTRIETEKAGGLSRTFPDLADRVADVIYNHRMTIQNAIETSPVGNWAELNNWRNKMHAVMEELVDA